MQKNPFSSPWTTRVSLVRATEKRNSAGHMVGAHMTSRFLRSTSCLRQRKESRKESRFREEIMWSDASWSAFQAAERLIFPFRQASGRHPHLPPDPNAASEAWRPSLTFPPIIAGFFFSWDGKVEMRKMKQQACFTRVRQPSEETVSSRGSSQPNPNTSWKGFFNFIKPNVSSQETAQWWRDRLWTQSRKVNGGRPWQQQEDSSHSGCVALYGILFIY